MRLAGIFVLLLLPANTLCAQILLRGGDAYYQDFSELGTSPNALLPEGITVGFSEDARTIVPYEEAQITSTNYLGGSLMSPDMPAGVYNLGAGDSTSARSRALGIGLGDPDARSATIYFAFINDTGDDLTTIRLGWTSSTYNCGSNPSRLLFEPYISPDGQQYEKITGSSLSGCGTPRGFRFPPFISGGAGLGERFSEPVAPQDTFFVAFLFSIEEGGEASNSTIRALEHFYLAPSSNLPRQVPIWSVPLERKIDPLPVGVRYSRILGKVFIPFDGTTYNVTHEVTGPDAEHFEVSLSRPSFTSSSNFHVAFTPGRPGLHEATVVFSKGDTTTYPVHLSGEGLPLILEEQTAATLRASLRDTYAPGQRLTSDQAGDTLIVRIDGGLLSLDRGISIGGFFTRFNPFLPATEDPTDAACNGDDNPDTCSSILDLSTEPIWPEPFREANEELLGDLHSLITVRGDLSAARQNLLFGEIADTDADQWLFDDTTQTTIPVDLIDLHAEIDFDAGLLEPPEDRKGDLARRMAYIYAMYEDQLDKSFLDQQKEVLLNWHRTDPISLSEIDRSEEVEAFQGNMNPMLLDTSLVRRSFEEPVSGTNVEELTGIPSGFSISPIYPNPTTGLAQFTVKTSAAHEVEIELFDMLGRRLKTLFKAPVLGEKRIDIDASQLPTGIYVIRSKTKLSTNSQRMVVVH